MQSQINTETGTKYSRAELKAAFELVENKENWKMPIVKALTLSNGQREVIEEAVVFFAGCRPTFTPIVNVPGKYLVEAVGYYNAVGA